MVLLPMPIMIITIIVYVSAAMGTIHMTPAPPSRALMMPAMAMIAKPPPPPLPLSSTINRPAAGALIGAAGGADTLSRSLITTP